MTLALVASGAPAGAQGAEPVCEAQIIASYPNGTWLENLAQDRLYDAVQQRHTQIDVLFANAGGGAMLPLGSSAARLLCNNNKT